MKGFKDTNNKLNGDMETEIVNGEKRSKAYAKIIGEQSNYMAEQEYQRQNYRYFLNFLSKFSTGVLVYDIIHNWTIIFNNKEC